MLQKNKGFFLLELLLSLSAWFMMGLFFMPLVVELTNQYRQLVVDEKAHQLLYEELEGKLIGEQTYTNYSVFHNDLEYKINWRESPVANQKEVCVIVDKNAFLQRTEICILQE